MNHNVMTKVRLLTIPLIAMLLLVAIGCNEPPEKVARNAIAAATGAISDSQQKYVLECTSNPSNKVCGIINRAVYAQNAAITGLESYCGYNVGVLLPKDDAPCVPVKSALGGLKVAVTNLDQIIKELTSAAGVKRTGKMPYRPPKQQPVNLPVMPEPMRAGLDPGAIGLGLLALKILLDRMLKGEVKDISDDSIDAVQAAIDKYEAEQPKEVTFGEVEGMRLHTLWPDAPTDSIPKT